MKLALCLLAAFALDPLQEPRAPTALSSRWRVEVEREEGELFCSVRADQDPLLDVLREIAVQADLSLDGVQTSWRRTLVSADLRHRPLRQTLAFLLGSVGLQGEVRQGALYVREGGEDTYTKDELYDSALASYLRALREFPEHPQADDAVRSQARIEASRDHHAAARAHYEALIERYPNSELAPEAMFMSGGLLMREGAWQEASQRLSDLLRLDVEHAYEPLARLELAYCVAELGAYERALYMIDALEGIAAPRDADEERRRAHVRIRAMAGLGQGRQALALLEDIDRRLGFATTKRESLALRAAACESAGLHEEAARAWLSYGRVTDGAERARAYGRAARLAVDGGDELSALFITQLAKREGIELGEVGREARQRLSLDESELGATTPVQRLARAERLFSSSLHSEALKALQSIEPLVPQLTPDEQLRFVRVYTRALASELGLDAALAYLRTALVAIEDGEARRGLYVLAAELLEQDGRLADAIEAYRGRI
jgi:tetratricopeptide (TPR) repeat protein